VRAAARPLLVNTPSLIWEVTIFTLLRSKPPKKNEVRPQFITWDNFNVVRERFGINSWD